MKVLENAEVFLKVGVYHKGNVLDTTWNLLETKKKKEASSWGHEGNKLPVLSRHR